jgi:ribosome-binding protein aMBF1 (putative translation factor)
MRSAWSGLRKTGGHPSTRTPNVVLGRKFCPDCGRWRHLCDFPHRRDEEPYSYCTHCSWHRVKRYRETSPIALERKRESERFGQERRRREAGVPVRVFRNRRTVVDRPERVFFEPDPLVKRLKQEDSIEELARRAGLHDKTIRRILSGESKHVRIDVADKLASGLGLTLFLVYGDQELVRLPPPRRSR